MSQKTSFSLLIGIHSVDSALARAPQQVRLVTIADECRNPRAQELAGRAREAGIQVVTESRAVSSARP